MKLPVRTPLMLLLIIATCHSLIFATERETSRPKTGSNVGPLQFKDIRYLTRSLSDFKEQKAFVLIACNTTCPLVKRYLPQLKRLEQKYGPQGVQFIALHTGPYDSIREIAEFAIEQEIPFPNVQDIKNGSVQAIGLERTPEVAVLDAQYQLRYRGRIDDQYRIGGALPRATENNLVDALEAVLKNEPVKVPETNVDGCTITPHTPERVSKSV
ncbi:MAG: redoxin family protein [Planctomycetaceae bacterium]|nr:redoxin family protein [Planctomycetaceae bacterium]